MNKDIIAGRWAELKGTIKSKWGELRHNDLERDDGDAEYLVGLLREAYGWDREDAIKAVREFEKTL